MDFNVNKAVIVCRCCPIHLGHESMINEMVGIYGYSSSMLLLGSANSPFSLRNFFSYSERRDFVSARFPFLRIAPIPDFPTNQEWLVALDDLLKIRGFDPSNVTFYGGCEEDVSVLIDDGRKYNIVNRFDGTTPKISATEVRDALIHNRSLDGLLDQSLHQPVKELFTRKWEKFKKM